MACPRCWVPWRRWTFILVAGPLAGDGGFLLPSPFCQGDGRYSFIGFDSLGGVLGDVSCGASKVWSPLPGGEVDLDRCGGGDGELETGDEEDDDVS